MGQLKLPNHRTLNQIVMKIHKFPLVALVVAPVVAVALCGCGSPAGETAAPPSQAASTKNIPAPAQSLMAEGTQQKSQMDAMRARAAANGAAPGAVPVKPAR